MSGAVHYLEQHFFTFHESSQIPLLILLSSSNSTQEQSHINCFISMVPCMVELDICAEHSLLEANVPQSIKANFPPIFACYVPCKHLSFTVLFDSVRLECVPVG